jgi:cell division septation protein DedD
MGREPNQVIIVNQEGHEGLPQNDEAISETNPIVVEDPIRPAMPLQAMEGADKSVPNLGEMALSYPYSVYLGSFLTFKRVQNADSIYRKMGLSPYWVKVDLGEKGVWFRVFTGYFKKKEAAEAFIKENQIAEASSKRTKYATLIGTYTSEEKLEMNRLALLELGYCPYIIDGINPESKLYIGAFYTKAGAEKQYADLASKGIQSQVVRR